jgi:hypothetical protein
MSTENSLEIEAKLIICSANPLKVVADISRLSTLAGYSLLKQDSVAIHDYYVDTPDRRLKAAECSLRVREINNSPWLTLKGPHRLMPQGLVEQSEIEVPWSRDSLPRISDDLGHYGVRLPAILPESQSTPPLEVLSLMGLERVQYRENYRQIRNVMEDEGTTGPALAELSIDSVVYHFGNLQLRHYEVEVEAKSIEGIDVLPVILGGLLDAYPDTLQKWDHGKLSIGRAIETLLAQGALEGLVNDRDELLPAAYSRVHQLLEQNRS